MHSRELKRNKHITIIAPVYNEEESVPLFYHEVKKLISQAPYEMRLLFVNDGSRDRTGNVLSSIAQQDKRVGYIEFSRNFGKEAATSAGLHAADGDAAILIDADLQHPVELIPTFIDHWEHGADIVVGIRDESQSDSFIKRTGSKLFYRMMHKISETQIIPRATDFRLLDRTVIEEFKKFTEHERMTRGLIDWLGYRRAVVPFRARERVAGKAQYSISKLWNLAISSIIAHSLLPLRVAGYLGAIAIPLSFVLGVVMFIDRFVHPLGYHFSGPAILADLLVFLVGLILLCIGLLAYYVAHIFKETQNRPIYIIRRTINV